MNIQKLKELTKEAKKLNDLERLRLQKEKDKTELLRIKKAEELAQEKFTKAVFDAELQAREGKNTLRVEEIRDYYAFKNKKNVDNPEFNLTGSGLVWSILVEKLKEYGFNVEVKYCYDGGGIESWHTIIIDW